MIAVATAVSALAAPVASAEPAASAAIAEAAAVGGPACPVALPDIPGSDFAEAGGTVPRPVVLVHGWDASAKSMQGYASLLKRSKVLHEPLVPFLFDYSADSGRWASIPAIAACLGAYVNKISAAYKSAGGDGKVLAVGHSMGGLAIRFSSSAQYAAQPDGAVLGGVVTIDTPHLGSPWGDTAQAQLLQDFAQLKAGNWLEGMFPWPIGSDGQTCLATHEGTAGMPPGCPAPPWLPADVPVAEIGGDITVQRQVMGYTIDTDDTRGDAVVATASSLGYQPSSGPGAPPAPVAAPATYTDRCQITTGQVETGIGGYGISLLQGFESGVLAVFSRSPGTNYWNSPLTQPVATFLSLANTFAPCAHTNIINPATDPFASLDVLRALNADIDRLNGKPAFSGLLKASGMPHATAPVAVPGGYEAAAWDNTGRVTFWRWTSGSQAWARVGASTYPVLPATFGTPDATVTGALLAGMSDATFIAQGQFSGDGTGSFIAFTNGPRGWGTIAPGLGGTLIPSGNSSTDNTTPGEQYTELFDHGDLEISTPGSLPYGPNGEEWQIGTVYAWSNGAFRLVSTTQFTASTATPLPATSPSLPAAACQRAPSGMYQGAAVSATTTFTNPGTLARPYLPVSVVLHVQGDGTAGGCDFTVAPDFPVVISASTASGTVWITAPAWTLTSDSIGGLLPGAELPGQDGLGASEFEDPEYSPYYIPGSFGITQVNRWGSVAVSLANGHLSALTVLPS